MPINDSATGRNPDEENHANSYEDAEVSYKYVEERFESTIEERTDGTTYRITYTRNTSTRLERQARWKPQFRFPWRTSVALLVFILLIVIGLIAVGPEGVWQEIKDLLPTLFD